MDLFERNKEVFQSRYPAIWSVLEAVEPPTSKPVVEDGRVINIDLGEASLYPQPGPDWARTQVEEYFRAPDRICLSDPAERILSKAAERLLPDLDKYLSREVGGGLEPMPVTDMGFAFIFGVGLGHHLPLLMERCQVRTWVLVEPVPEFLFHSLSSVDWTEVFDRVARMWGEVRFLVGKSPERAMLEIEAELVHGMGKSFLDGSYAFVHYPTWDLQQGRRLLNERIPNFYFHSSYLEDEVLMVENTFGNLSRWSCHLIDGRARVESQVPLFIIGSGPSLDADLPHIQALRDKAVVFSCGSALGVLLKNGIRPDFHIENENTTNLVANLKRFRDDFGLDGIRFVAATTVPPEASALFDQRWYYCRALLSPNIIFDLSAEPLPYTGPVVSNAAASVATALGFTNIHLFGVDCGRRIGAGHHAQDAVYYEDGYDNFATEKGDSAEALDTDFTRQVPGNFGGEVATSSYLDLSRRTMTELQRVRGVSFVNCSNGARIDGAIPRAGASLKLSGATPEGRIKILASLDEALPNHPAGSFLREIDLPSHLMACDTLARELDKLLVAVRADNGGFWDLTQRLHVFRKVAPPASEGIVRLVMGSFMSMVYLATYRFRRIPDGHVRDDFSRFTINGLRRSAGEIFGETRTLLENLQSRLSTQ